MIEWMVAPFIPDFSTRWGWVVNLTPRSLYLRDRTMVHIPQEAEWVLGSIWVIWRRDKNIAPVGDSDRLSPNVLPIT